MPCEDKDCFEDCASPCWNIRYVPDSSHLLPDDNRSGFHVLPDRVLTAGQDKQFPQRAGKIPAAGTGCQRLLDHVFICHSHASGTGNDGSKPADNISSSMSAGPSSHENERRKDSLSLTKRFSLLGYPFSDNFEVVDPGEKQWYAVGD